MLETYLGVVYPHQGDHMDHLNAQRYAAKFDQEMWRLVSTGAISQEYIHKNNRGMAAAEQTTNYKVRKAPENSMPEKRVCFECPASKTMPRGRRTYLF